MVKKDDMIQLIYESACNGNFENMLHELASHLESNKGFISLVDKVNQQVPLYQLAAGERVPNMHSDLEWMIAKHSTTMESDPLYLPCSTQDEGRIFDDRLVDAKRLVNSDYFNEVYVPVDTRYVVGVNLINNPNFYGVLVFNRSKNQVAYNQKDYDKIEHWKPHLRRALMIQLQLGEKNHRLKCCQSMLNQSSYALALLNQFGCVEIFNTKFEALCRQPTILQCINGKLHSNYSKLNDQLQFAIREAIKVLCSASTFTCPKTIITPTFGQFPEIAIEISPFISSESDSNFTPFKGILVAVKTTKGSNVERAEQVYNLTRAEKRLVQGLMKGFSLSEITENQNVAISTVRSHLKSVLKKTQTHSQTELIILINKLSIY